MFTAVVRHRANTARAARSWDVSATFRSCCLDARCGFSSDAKPPFIDPFTEPPDASTFPAYHPKDYFSFELIHQSTKSNARVGRIHTPHGPIETPGFVAVGTNGALKAAPHGVLRRANLDLMFANTYHLMLQPGAGVVEQAGGLHTFMGRNKPLITDSGGFQVFSLGAIDASDKVNELKKRTKSKHKDGNGLIKQINETGVTFKSYRDGSVYELTPESSVAAQKQLGADIIIPLDELPPYGICDLTLKKSVFKSHRWEARSLRTHLLDLKNQAMYGVVHGGVNDELRELSATYLSSLPFDGFAIGGSLGKDTEELVSMLRKVLRILPDDKPNHVLGIGDPQSVEACVSLGADTFDSTFPTRSARHGSLLTKTRGRINVRNKKFKTLFEPPCWECPCSLCKHHSLAYLHHLDRAKEPMAWTLATEHNLHYMGGMMKELREGILRNEV